MIPSILVVGCGVMGSGIAQVAALHGHSVSLYDARAGAAEAAKQKIARTLAREVEKGRCSAELRGTTLERLQPVSTLEEASGADIALEAIRERLEEKQSLFQKLDALLRPDALLLSNTSMISITHIAQSTSRPERVAGCHFFNPVPRMELVEVISGARTSSGTVAKVIELVSRWEKTAILAPDTPGFIVNRALLMLLNEAAFLVEEGSAPEDVDAAMKLGCNFPMGPLQLIDLIGVDVILDCQTALWKQFDRRPKYEPCLLLEKMVNEGKLGRKSQNGFYRYS